MVVVVVEGVTGVVDVISRCGDVGGRVIGEECTQ